MSELDLEALEQVRAWARRRLDVEERRRTVREMYAALAD